MSAAQVTCIIMEVFCVGIWGLLLINSWLMGLVRGQISGYLMVMGGRFGNSLGSYWRLLVVAGDI